MKTMFIAFLVALAAAACWSEEIPCEKIVLNDGRTFLGAYDTDAKVLTIMDEKSGKVLGKIPIDQADIKERSNATIAVAAADPTNKLGLNGRWLTDYATALQLAKEQNRPILALFTGSDWCPWCVKLEREVLSQKQFKEWAKEHFVLLLIDFPRKPISAKLKEHNARVAQQFGVTGYPRILFIDGNGQANPWKWGYKEGGVENWIQVVNQSLKIAD